MKKKGLLFLLIPLLLTSCGKNGASFKAIKERIDAISDEELFPYYHVSGMMDFDNQIIDVDEDFTRSPKSDTYVPYARYNEGFYNAALDDSEPNPEDVIIYGMSSKSYFLRAPLRITKANFYQTVANTSGTGKFNGISININYETGRIGSIGDTIVGAKIYFEDLYQLNVLTMEYEENGTPKKITLNREGTISEDTVNIYNGTWKNTSNTLVLVQGERENRTCANALLRSIITSYAGQSGSINPSINTMKYELLDNGGFAFVGEKSHTNVMIDNFPYYFDPERLGIEWDETNPLPCYKSQVNAKVNIRFEYNSDGWLVKESMTSLDYDYNKSSDSQISLVSVYTYKFSD